MRHWWYKLDENKKPIPISSDEVDWLDEHRRVALDTVDGVQVSTVFVCLDHQFDNDGPPLLFETMVFGGKFDDRQWRYSTWEEAVQGHQAALALVRGERQIDLD